MEKENIKVKNEKELNEREKAHLDSESCKNFMKTLWEWDAKLRDNPEAQAEQAKTLW